MTNEPSRRRGSRCRDRTRGCRDAGAGRSAAGPTAPSGVGSGRYPASPLPPADYNQAGVPSLDFVRDKIEGRYGRSLGSTELAQETPEARSFEEQAAKREEAAQGQAGGDPPVAARRLVVLTLLALAAAIRPDRARYELQEIDRARASRSDPGSWSSARRPSWRRWVGARPPMALGRNVFGLSGAACAPVSGSTGATTSP